MLNKTKLSAAGTAVTAAAIAATDVSTAAITATIVIAAAAPDNDQQNDNPAAVAATKTVIAHMRTSYEMLTV